MTPPSVFAINRLWTGGGADGPESYSRVLFEATAPDNPLGWREDARKALIILGDNFPHDNDINEGSAARHADIPRRIDLHRLRADVPRSGSVGR